MIILKLLLTFILTFFFIKLIIKNASVLGLIDIPNERSSHTKITPRGAGIGLGLAFFVSILLFDFSFFIENWLVFLAIFLVFLIGILDDHKDASPKAKFYVIMLATLLVYFDDIAIYSIGSFFGVELSLWYFALPFTMFALAGFTNALNLIDGLDGLAGSVSIIILSTFLYIGYVNQDQLIITLTSTTITVLCAFMLFNWNPASIFMGDSGSLFLGFIISLVTVISIQYIHPITILYLAAILILDTIVLMIRRIRKVYLLFLLIKHIFIIYFLSFLKIM
jgi:UDP-GlcNAc:undecaprenyl-phosphate GlcNAc-1-phosphate transferase